MARYGPAKTRDASRTRIPESGVDGLVRARLGMVRIAREYMENHFSGAFSIQEPEGSNATRRFRALSRGGIGFALSPAPGGRGRCANKEEACLERLTGAS